MKVINKENIYILGIESSCDDTSASIIHNGKVLSNITETQVDHEKYGGVVPELASRQHNTHIAVVVKEALDKANVTTNELSAIAVTAGPGLMGSLLVGVSFAKSLAFGLQIPIIGVHHMHAHILAHFLQERQPEFPFICLTVSGGHTQLVKVKAYNDMSVLGSTIDDAAGEAFDKTGKMMGLPYPAGPIIDRMAEKGKPAIAFSKSKMDGYDFSFSGFKTSVLYYLQAEVKKDPNYIEHNINDLCASIQHGIIAMLTEKLIKVVNDTGIKRVAIAGGVSANKGLRSELQRLASLNDWELFIPDFQYCTDNAAMIGISGYFKYLDGIFDDQQLVANPRFQF
ncbi:MAG TPA: tRNA (adenosine(37)-N6)-threonylcarbamoyltransferase complex transferase subunit TsaD [Saprospiraceae bacterium]|nr:tRNA (adenosine(37)-N6)-threonylcarbamoyltransferase complex transferase subunit TsaD [Saprospiraceae bacterium]HPN72303.1 tRNA (adenosine(37)-N6)-threonylcarbamoyltransferase complex transferase subunit TsaD [Saprospiraceae bacterium]